MKIVSLLPSATENICALGLREHLVAVSHECDYPSDLSALPRITSSIIPHGLEQNEIDALVREAIQKGESLYHVDGTLLKELDADIIVTQGLCDVCAVTPQVVEASLRGVSCRLSADTHLLSMDGTSFEGICNDLQRLAVQTQLQARGAQIIQDARQEWNKFAQKERSDSHILLLEWVDPFFSAGHWVPEQIEAVGFRSAIGSPSEHSRRIDVEEVAESNPDFIGVVCCGFDLQNNVGFAEKLYAHPQLQKLEALQKERVWAFDANSYFSRPTLRIVQGAALIHKAFAEDKAVLNASQRVQRPK